MKRHIFKFINKALSYLDVQVVHTRRIQVGAFNDIFDANKPDNQIVHLNKLAALSDNIVGMINHRAGEELFSLAFMQTLKGDVVEVGSFQGKSTFFLGHAVAQSENGRMYAIDHFKGNKGKEKFYIVGKADLSDLETGFKKNMEDAGLGDSITLINKPSHEAVADLRDNSVRFLFIDGDHTPEGVKRDLELFKPKLKSGSIIVFDDYDQHTFGGLVSVVNEFISTTNCRRKYLLDRTLILELCA